MDFKKRLNTRLYLSISYLAIGLILTIIVYLLNLENNFLSSLGAILIVCGIARIRNHMLITKSNETIRKQEIIETDERNILISTKAKSFAFNCYIVFACISVIILEIANISIIASALAFSVSILVLLYWLSYFIIRSKS